MDWIVSPINSSNCILDSRLTYARASILITYETGSGRRYVKQVECYHGRVNKKIGGKLIAWMFVPEPFDGP